MPKGENARTIQKGTGAAYAVWVTKKGRKIFCAKLCFGRKQVTDFKRENQNLITVENGRKWKVQKICEQSAPKIQI